MPVPLIRKDYLLSEAFELIGKRLFGDNWNGFELGQGRVPSPDELARARTPYLEALKRIETEIADIDDGIKRSVKEPEIRTLQRRGESRRERRAEAIRELNSHPEPTDMNRSLFDAYQRRQRAETTLIDAIARGTVKIHNGRNCPIDNVLWKAHPHFGYTLSYQLFECQGHSTHGASNPLALKSVSLTHGSIRWSR